jgi:hypothetical protein
MIFIPPAFPVLLGYGRLIIFHPCLETPVFFRGRPVQRLVTPYLEDGKTLKTDFKHGAAERMWGAFSQFRSNWRSFQIFPATQAKDTGSPYGTAPLAG